MRGAAAAEFAGFFFDLVDGEDFHFFVGDGAFAGGDGGVYVLFAFASGFGGAFAGGDFGFEAFFGDEKVVVALAEAVGFIADVLEEFEAGVGAGEFDGAGAGLDEDFFFAFGEGDDHGGFDVPLVEGVLGGVELSEAAVDEDDVGVEFGVLACVAVTAGDDFLDGFVVVNTGDRFDAIAAVAVFERAAVDEADEGADGGFALKVCDVNAFDAADGFGEFEDVLEGFEAGAVVLEEDFGLDVFVGGEAGAFGEGAHVLDLVSEGGCFFEVEGFGGGFHVGGHFAYDV